jgi:HSP90 family molecular chaperone
MSPGFDLLYTNRGEDFWQKPLEAASKDIKLMVKRVFITSDLGENALPKWASWVKVVIDGKLEVLYDFCPLLSRRYSR